MNARPSSFPSALIAVAALMVLLETLCFASLQPGYSHVANTISELGETDALYAHLVAFGFFLPVGLLVWLALWLVHCETPEKDASLILAALSCLGTGYALAAFFPCDHGAPFFGTWRMQVHNVLGFIDYVGTGIGFLLVSCWLARRNAKVHAIAFLAAGAAVLLAVVLFSIERTFSIRGAVQRVAEAVQFTGVFFACSLLAKYNRRHEMALAK